MFLIFPFLCYSLRNISYFPPAIFLIFPFFYSSLRNISYFPSAIFLIFPFFYFSLRNISDFPLLTFLSPQYFFNPILTYIPFSTIYCTVFLSPQYFLISLSYIVFSAIILIFSFVLYNPVSASFFIFPFLYSFLRKVSYFLLLMFLSQQHF